MTNPNNNNNANERNPGQNNKPASGRPDGAAMAAELSAAIDAIVNGMLDAQAEGELHRLEQLRRMALHAGPDFDEAVQARLAQHTRLLSELSVELAPSASSQLSERVVGRVMARVRAEKNHEVSPFPEVAEQALDAAKLDAAKHDVEIAASTGDATGGMASRASRARGRKGSQPQQRALVSHAPSPAVLPALSQDFSPTQEGQGGRSVRPVHHRRRWFSSTTLAFFAGGLVTLALVSVQLWFGGIGPAAGPVAGPLAGSLAGSGDSHASASQAASPAAPKPRIALTLDELTSKAFFSPDELPMITMPDEQSAGSFVLRFGNAFADGPLAVDTTLPGTMASSASSPSALEMQAQLRMQDAGGTPSQPLDPSRMAAGSGVLTPEQRAQAMRLLTWGLAPWELNKPLAGEGAPRDVGSLPMIPLQPATKRGAGGK